MEHRDAVQKRLWEEAYRAKPDTLLWGEDPVPFCRSAVEKFRMHGMQRVLEIPCGDGRNTVELASGLPQLIAADTSRAALGRLADSWVSHKSSVNLRAIEADVYHLPFADSSLDGIFCWDLLSHLSDPEDALGEMVRVCTEGGLVIGNLFSVGDENHAVNMTLVQDGEYIFDERFTFRYYDPRTAPEVLLSSTVTLDFLELVRWRENPHYGYRENEHEHESWAFVLKKRGTDDR